MGLIQRRTGAKAKPTPRDGKYVMLVNSDGAVFASENFGLTYERRGTIPNISSSRSGSIAISGNGRHVYMGSNADALIYYSTDNGRTFTTKAALGIVPDLSASYNGQHLAVATAAGFMMSNDFGKTFRTPLPEAGAMLVDVSASGRFIIVGTTSNVRVSRDYGNTFSVIAQYAYMVAVSGNGKYMMIVSSPDYNNNKGIVFSSDYGETWIRHSDYKFPSDVRSAAISYDGKYAIVSEDYKMPRFSSNYGTAGSWRTLVFDGVQKGYSRLAMSSSGIYTAIWHRYNLLASSDFNQSYTLISSPSASKSVLSMGMSRDVYQ